MQVGVPQRSTTPAALLVVAWTAAVAACVLSAWGSFPRGGPQPHGILDDLWPTLFNWAAALSGVALFPLTWVALDPPYRKTIPSAFLSCVAALVVSYVSPPGTGMFVLSLLYGILAVEGLRATMTYLVHVATPRDSALPMSDLKFEVQQ